MIKAPTSKVDPMGPWYGTLVRNPFSPLLHRSKPHTKWGPRLQIPAQEAGPSCGASPRHVRGHRDFTEAPGLDEGKPQYLEGPKDTHYWHSGKNQRRTDKGLYGPTVLVRIGAQKIA